MPVPYGSDEVAVAVAERLESMGLAGAGVHVVGDERSGEWIVRLTLASGERRGLRVPFSTRQGITTPREIADSCAHIIGSGG